MTAQEQAATALYHAITEAARARTDDPASLLTLAQAYSNAAYGPQGGAMRWDYHNTGARLDSKLGFG